MRTDLTNERTSPVWLQVEAQGRQSSPADRQPADLQGGHWLSPPGPRGQGPGRAFSQESKVKINFKNKIKRKIKKRAV